ncbi:MAG: hypothetical protein R3B72_51885 [Polyangiaceae bacterium]
MNDSILTTWIPQWLADPLSRRLTVGFVDEAGEATRLDTLALDPDPARRPAAASVLERFVRAVVDHHDAFGGQAARYLLLAQDEERTALSHAYFVHAASASSAELVFDAIPSALGRPTDVFAEPARYEQLPAIEGVVRTLTHAHQNLHNQLIRQGAPYVGSLEREVDRLMKRNESLERGYDAARLAQEDALDRQHDRKLQADLAKRAQDHDKERFERILDLIFTVAGTATLAIQSRDKAMAWMDALGPAERQAIHDATPPHAQPLVAEAFERQAKGRDRAVGMAQRFVGPIAVGPAAATGTRAFRILMGSLTGPQLAGLTPHVTPPQLALLARVKAWLGEPPSARDADVELEVMASLTEAQAEALRALLNEEQRALFAQVQADHQAMVATINKVVAQQAAKAAEADGAAKPAAEGEAP